MVELAFEMTFDEYLYEIACDELENYSEIRDLLNKHREKEIKKIEAAQFFSDDFQNEIWPLHPSKLFAFGEANDYEKLKTLYSANFDEHKHAFASVLDGEVIYKFPIDIYYPLGYTQCHHCKTVSSRPLRCCTSCMNEPVPLRHNKREKNFLLGTVQRINETTGLFCLTEEEDLRVWWYKFFGYTVDEMLLTLKKNDRKKYEERFEEVNKTWHIDHIVAHNTLRETYDLDKIRMVTSVSNLQFLKASENMEKGKDFTQEDLERSWTLYRQSDRLLDRLPPEIEYCWI
jgi:hypothetical protein